jgi:hypothetical protein
VLIKSELREPVNHQSARLGINSVLRAALALQGTRGARSLQKC